MKSRFNNPDAIYDVRMAFLKFTDFELNKHMNLQKN